MKTFDPSKLQVEFRDGITSEEPIEGRKYTLTHSDETADLFLTIGTSFAFDKINAIRDEVFMEWMVDEQGNFYLHGSVYVNGGTNSAMSEKRDEIFRRELPMALQGIRYGDNEFFENYPELEDAQIWIYFDSENPEYNQYEFWGTPKDYRM